MASSPFAGVLAVLLCMAACGGSNTPATAAAQPRSTAPGGNYVIAVISDGYSSDDEWEFNRDFEGFITNGLLVDPFYSQHTAALTIEKHFKAVDVSGHSQFGIVENYDPKRCYIDWIPDGPNSGITSTTSLINSAVGSTGPDVTVVIGNEQSQSFGCSPNDTDWLYISAYARTSEPSGVLEHEFGHRIGGLFDEYAFAGSPYDGPYPTPPPVVGPNCSTENTPSWMNLNPPSGTPHPGKIPGCRFYQQNIYHPYPDCRMKATDQHQQFCFVCEKEMTDTMNTLSNAANPSASLGNLPVVTAGFGMQPSVSSTENQVRLLIRIDAVNNSARVITSEDVTRPVTNRQRRVGDYVYEIVGNGPVITGVLPGDPFQVRSYGAGGAPHDATPTRTAAAVIFIPGATRQGLASRSIAINFYRLDPQTSRANVTPELLARYKLTGQAHQVANVPPDEIRRAVASP